MCHKILPLVIKLKFYLLVIILPHRWTSTSQNYAKCEIFFSNGQTFRPINVIPDQGHISDIILWAFLLNLFMYFIFNLVLLVFYPQEYIFHTSPALLWGNIANSQWTSLPRCEGKVTWAELEQSLKWGEAPDSFRCASVLLNQVSNGGPLQTCQRRWIKHISNTYVNTNDLYFLHVITWIIYTFQRQWLF